MTKYSIVISTEDGPDQHETLTAKSDDQAYKQLTAWLKTATLDEGAKVFLAWGRDSDGCSGYLNRGDGASATGKSWV